jgi:predicted nucleic acid-binding protein
MIAKIFVDTNILVYCRDASEPEKQQQAMTWMAQLWETGCGRLSFQVLQEFYVTVTQKLNPGLDISLAQTDVRSLLTWRPLTIDGRVMAGAWFIQERYGLEWWDALIVAAAQISGCAYLLTEDLQEAQLLGNLEVINPFRRTFASISPQQQR